jgi:hypothetical protein
MKRLAPVLTMILMCVVLCSGCAVTKEVYMVGVFANGQYIDLEAQKLKPPLNETITLDHETVYKVKDEAGGTVYSVLVGWEAPEATHAKVRIQQPGDPTFRIEEGWMHMAGRWPMACTARLAVTPDGTRAILQVVGDGGPQKAHRVYLRELEECHHLAVRLGALARHLDTPGWHVTSPQAGVLDQPVQTTGSEAAFAHDVEALFAQVP